MPTREDIVLAMGTHLWWKRDFEQAVSDGWHFLNPGYAARCLQSDLGDWLADPALAEADSEPLRIVQSRYADFHEATAEVVRLAVRGQIEQAEASIHSGAYAETSMALTLALRDWTGALRPIAPAPRQEGLGLPLVQAPSPHFGS